MIFQTPHSWSSIVEFEDVDAGFAVHHPKYLYFCERARCAALAEGGYPIEHQLQDQVSFVVAEARMHYLRSLRLGQRYWIHTFAPALKRSSLKVIQAITDHEIPTDHFPNMDSLVYSGWEGLSHPPLFTVEMRLVFVNLAERTVSQVSERMCKAIGADPDMPRIKGLGPRSDTRLGPTPKI
jgi:YbgC/YbaW family acyl-CoA thioester hydrolase